MPGETLSGDLNGAPDPAIANAQTRVIGVQGIASTLGAQALQDGPIAGVHPDVAMRAPDAVAPVATASKNGAAIASSPPVQQFLNTVDDAHVAVAQADLPGLAKVGRVMGQYAASGGPFGDIAKAFAASAGALGPDIAAYYKAASTPKVGGFADIPAALKVGGDVLGVASSPFAAITEPLAKGEAAIPLPMYVNGKPLTDFDSKLEQARKDIGLAMFGLGPEAGRGAGASPLTAREVPTGSPPIDLLPGPDGVFRAPLEVPRIGVHPETDQARGSVAAVDAAAMSHAQETIAASQVHSLSPQTMETFLAQQPSERMVQVDPEVLVQLAAEGHEPFPEHAADIARAVESGEGVDIPLSRYLTRTSGQPFAETLNNATIFRPDGTSVDAAAEGGSGGGAQVPAGRSSEQFSEAEAPRAQYLAEDTREEMEKVVKAQFLEPLFKDPAAIGMTKGQFERYNAQIEDAIANASDKLLQRAYDQIRRERTPEWKTAVAQHSAAVEQELARQPAIRARAALVNNRGPLGEPLETPALKLDRADVLSLYGKDLGLPDKMFAAGASSRPLVPKGFKVDVPNEDWLASKQRYAEQDMAKYTGHAGKGLAGSITAYTHERLDIPTSALAKLKGANDERRGPGDYQYEQLLAEAAKNGFDNSKSPILVQVNHKGEAYITEGNTRVAVAKALGVPTVKTEIQWRNGGERAQGPMTPEKVAILTGVKRPPVGLAPDEVAAQFGYPSGADMLRDLDRLNQLQGDRTPTEHMKDMVRAEAENRARAQLGFTVDPEAIYNEASRLVNGPKVTDFLATELQYLAEAAGLPFDKATIKALAIDRFNAKPVRDAISLKKLEGFVYKGGVKAEKALLRGDAATAFLRKQQQFIHHLQLAQAHKFVKLYNTSLRRWARLAKKAAIRSMDQNALDDIHAELQRYGYKVPQSNLAYNYAKYVESMAAKGIAVQPPLDVPPIDPKDMNVEQFSDLADRIKTMVTQGREARQIEVRGRKEELAALNDEVAAIAQGLRQRPALTTTTRSKLSKNLNQLDTELMQPRAMFDVLDDGDVRGPWHRALMYGADDSHAREVELSHKVLDQVRAIRESVPKDVRASWTSRVESGHGLTDPLTGEEMTLTKYDLMSVLLNMGSDINRWHLEEGGWGWDRNAYTALVDKHLTADEMNFAQQTWDLLDRELWPKVAEAERKRTGVVPEKRLATPVTFSNGVELRGGYFPLVKDRERTNAPSIREDLEKMFNDFMVDAATPKGFTKKVTGAQYPVLLDFQNVLFHHIPDVVKYLSYWEYVQGANRFLDQPAVVSTLRSRFGPSAQGQLENWLHRQVGFRMQDPRALQSASAFFRRWRENTYTVGAGLRLTVGLEHLSQVSQLAAVAGEKAALEGYLRWASDVGGTTRFALDNSTFLRGRTNEANRELRDLGEDINKDLAKLPGPLHAATLPLELSRKLAHFALNWINQYTVAVPSWTGAYWDARNVKAMSHGDAVRYADNVTARAHGSGAEKDLSQFQSGSNEFFKALNMYYNYHGNQFQLNRGALDKMVRGRNVRERAEGFRQGFWAIVVSALVGSIAAGHLPKNSKERALWFVDTILGGLANGIPVGREAYQMVSNMQHGRDINYEVSPLAQGPETVAKAGKDVAAMATHHRPSAHAVQHLIEAPGYFFGLPTGQAAASAQGVADIHKAGNKHPIKGVLFGPGQEKDQ